MRFIHVTFAAFVAAVAMLLCFASAPAYATTGVDVSSWVGPSTFSCMKSQGIDFAIVRGYESVGQVDPNGITTVYNARAAGIPYVDMYFFPCFRCGNPAGQINEFYHALVAKDAIDKIGMLWFDIEGPGTYWGGSCSENINFISTLISTAESLGFKVGIYTSATQWSPIACNNVFASKLPLWYSHYDGVQSFDDFVPFGGWARPAIKQYSGTGSICGASVDLDWYP
eukprot:GEZU01022227.1.p1 GENE.GEZU01022227.1~~GEZU01022227.1.p1  ORF type:complete len:250 (-),score=65.00 GEZU01022227.1:135-812(-)